MQEQTNVMQERTKVAHPPAPDAEYCRAYVTIGTNTTLALISEEVQHGVWMVPPPGTVSPATQPAQFSGRGRDMTALGFQATCVYQAPDGTTFTLNFGSPYQAAPYATIVGGGTSPTDYTYWIFEPLTVFGFDIFPIYTIKLNKSNS
jgi:hypothetical protein